MGSGGMIIMDESTCMVDVARFFLNFSVNESCGKCVPCRVGLKVMLNVLDRIIAEGPLMSKDFKADVKTKSSSTGMDWARNPLNLALRQLFMEGRIMVTGRRGFQKVYDLPERVLPSGVNTEPPTQEEYIRHLIRRDVRAHGVIKAREMGYLLKKNVRAELRLMLKEMVKSGELVEVGIEKEGAEPYFTFPGILTTRSETKPAEVQRILSPFDNLVIQRSRLEELFGFAYTLECYVPATKRKFGYFGLPLLAVDTFVGQIDLKADRKTGTLLVRNLTWVSGRRPRDEQMTLLVEGVQNFARFNGCDRIEVAREVRKNLPETKKLWKLSDDKATK